uniref:D-glutamate cyclase-like C-terminal domain-containing protein n=1 Tax=Spumella elongata TaxID=89044 RepID=A0A7S3HHU9_9STRA|mmetsp:Transcript_52982/g.92434  ORF Transcript_52982/g.92434 Transcript_52982/m.92434 type:complete len:396 (+) Transcript_52982:3-1190(+)
MIHLPPSTTMLGLSLFVIAPCALRLVQRKSSTIARNIKFKRATIANVKSLIASMEQVVQADEGKRGIHDIILPEGELYNAACEMITAKRVAVITGFPCMLTHSPPTETDGPLGALSIAKTLLMLGKDVVIITDECNEEVLLSCAAAATAHSSMLPQGLRKGTLTLESFPASTIFNAADESRLLKLRALVDLVVAIERAGPCKDGRYLTMRGYDMSHLVAPLELLLMPPDLLEGSDSLSKGPVSASKVGSTLPRSIGIGDGGNEVGMGRVYHRVVHSSITNAAEIACVVPTDHLLVSSVSNWGGYALSAATAALALLNNVNRTLPAQSAESGYSVEELRAHIDACLPSDAEETHKCERIVAAGARDGVTGQLALYVDGMPLSESLSILRRLRNVDL